MNRGEVWMVDFGPPQGPEQAGIRPAIIVQNGALIPPVATVILIPLTTDLARLALPSVVRVPAGEGGLPIESAALRHRVQVRGKARLLSKLGTLPRERLEAVEQVLLDVIGL